MLCLIEKYTPRRSLLGSDKWEEVNRWQGEAPDTRRAAIREAKKASIEEPEAILIVSNWYDGQGGRWVNHTYFRNGYEINEPHFMRNVS